MKDYTFYLRGGATAYQASEDELEADYSEHERTMIASLFNRLHTLHKEQSNLRAEQRSLEWALLELGALIPAEDDEEI